MKGGRDKEGIGEKEGGGTRKGRGTVEGARRHAKVVEGACLSFWVLVDGGGVLVPVCRSW